MYMALNVIYFQVEQHFIGAWASTMAQMPFPLEMKN